jgi:hypothetical protein
MKDHQLQQLTKLAGDQDRPIFSTLPRVSSALRMGMTELPPYGRDGSFLQTLVIKLANG